MHIVTKRWGLFLRMRIRNKINDPLEGVATTMEKVRAVFGLGLGASCVLAGGAAVFYVRIIMYGAFIFFAK